jgi:hypothetical protein
MNLFGMDPRLAALSMAPLNSSISSGFTPKTWANRCLYLRFRVVASLGRFERPTNCLEGSRSVQLSYRDVRVTLRFYDKQRDKTRRIYIPADL